MPDISTANQQKINGVMCPICEEFKFGSRIAYLTTAGAFSSGPILGCAITSGTHDAVQFQSALNYQLVTYAPAAATKAADIVGLTTMTQGVYLLDPADASGPMYHLTSAGTTGAWVKLINISLSATALVSFGATVGTVAEQAFFCSSTGYFGITVRANSAVELFCVSATRWIIIGSTKNVESLSPSTA
jgi:hypothetical protein